MAKKTKKKKKKAITRETSPTVTVSVKRLKKKKKKAITRETSPTVKTIPIMAKEEVLAGNYCNIANISHTEREFVLDFFFTIVEQSSLVSRVITSPQHIKKIYEVLGTNIEKYEKKFGKI